MQNRSIEIMRHGRGVRGKVCDRGGEGREHQNKRHVRDVLTMQFGWRKACKRVKVRGGEVRCGRLGTILLIEHGNVRTLDFFYLARSE